MAMSPPTPTLPVRWWSPVLVEYYCIHVCNMSPHHYHFLYTSCQNTTIVVTAPEKCWRFENDRFLLGWLPGAILVSRNVLVIKSFPNEDFNSPTIPNSWSTPTNVFFHRNLLVQLQEHPTPPWSSTVQAVWQSWINYWNMDLKSIAAWICYSQPLDSDS